MPTSAPKLIDAFGMFASGEPAPPGRGQRAGVLPRRGIVSLIEKGRVSANRAAFAPNQVQPASLDLRLGPVAYRLRASFLPGAGCPVEVKVRELQQHAIPLAGGAVLERGGVYLVQLQESLKLPESISAKANPKSSTGRLDVFTRLIADGSEAFDSVAPGYEGPLYAEIAPRTFGIMVREGSRLNQLRFRRLNAMHDDHHAFYLSDRKLRELNRLHPLVHGGEPSIRDGLQLRVDLRGADETGLVGFRAQRHTDIIDVDRVAEYRIDRFWDRLHAGAESRIILDPNEFYILSSKEAVTIPPHVSAEMAPIDPLMGEFRVHYAGFFDPGFGHPRSGANGSKAVLEVRSYEVPFILEDGQIIGRLAYEPLTEEPDTLYGSDLGSHYQAQGLKLSKHFRAD